MGSAPSRRFRHLTRRRFLGGVGAAALATFLSACGTDDDDPDLAIDGTADNLATSSDAVGDVEASDTSSGAFPVSIPHKFGTAEIPSEPQRVLVVGFSEQDALLALGVVPLAVREWFGEQPYATWPWAQDELGDGQPEVLTMPFGELDFERIASLQPDLIVGMHSGISPQEYATLAAIAPTLAQPGEYPDFGVPWQEQTRLIGRALGREALAEDLIEGAEAVIVAAAEAHPEFQGATIAWANPATAPGEFYVTGVNTPPIRFLSALGFEPPTELGAALGEDDSLTVSGEQVAMLDADVLICLAQSEEARAEIEAQPLYAQLNVAREGRTIFFKSLTDPSYGALSFSTVLSLPYAVGQLVPRLVNALDGDPATEA